jgi:plasmid stabilization system protein ParE
MEAYPVEIMPQADEELAEIAYFIALNNPKNSQRFIAELVATFTSSLSNSPEIGAVYQGDIRKLTYKKYTAFYRINTTKKLVEILHIVNLTKPLSARNIEF